MITDLTNLVDHRNQGLWEKINNTFEISVIQNKTIGYNCFGKENKIEISVSPDDLNPSSFTHELLHAYLRYNECFIGAAIKKVICADNFLSSVLSSELLEHLGNVLEHDKFLPMFLDLGFNRKDFLSDYQIRKCTDVQLDMISKCYKSGKKINKNAVDPYIGILSAILADPNPNFDYSKEYLIFKKLDEILFDALKVLFSEWKQINVESNNFLDDDYRDVVHAFNERLIDWYKSHDFK